MTTINFPSDPILNQTYQAGTRKWSWNGVYWKAESPTDRVGYTGSQGYTGSAGSVVASISATPPSTPALGDVWIDSATGIQYFYVDDGDSAQWVEFSNPGTSGTGTGGVSASQIYGLGTVFSFGG